MKRNSNLIGMAVGLSTLLGGCDDNTTRVLGVCNNGSLEVQAVYHEVSMGRDYLTVDLYENGQLVGSVATSDSELDAKGKVTWLKCGNEGNLYFNRAEYGRSGAMLVVA